MQEDATGTLYLKSYSWVEANSKRLVIAAIAVVIAMLLWGFYSWQQGQNEVAAGNALSAAIFSGSVPGPGALAKIASDYPGTKAGQRAQLQSAAALFGEGKFAEAQAQFQKFLDDTSSGPLAASAQLGVAACLESQGKLPEAAVAYQKVISNYSNSNAVLPAEFALGRINEQQGKLAEAQSHFDNAARSGFGGSLAQEAMGRAMELKSKLAPAATPSVPAAK